MNSYLVSFLNLLGKHKNHLIFLVLFFLFSLILILFLTYPLVTDPSNIVFGFTGDNFSSIWYNWWLKYSYHLGINADPSYFIGYPFGSDLVTNVAAEELLWTTPIKILTFLFNEVLAFNILVILSFPLSAVSMYLLSYYVTKSKAIAIFAGLAYAFTPYHFWQGYAHISLALTQWLPLYLLSLLYFEKVRTYLSAVFLAFSLFLVLMTTFYYGFFMLLITPVFLVWKALYHTIKRTPNYFNSQLLKSALMVVMVFSLLMSIFIFNLLSHRPEQSFNNIPKRTLNDLLSLSARPWDFLIPAPNHFLFGEGGQDFYINQIIPLTKDYKSISAFLPERVLYVSFTAVILSLVGLLVGLYKKRFRELSLSLLILSLWAGILASPAFIIVKGYTLYLPSYYLYELVPFFRAYVRIGTILQIFVILFACVGLYYLTHKLKPFTRILCISLATFLVLFEFAPKPGSSITDLRSITSAYKWLEKQNPEAVVVEYPSGFDIPDTLIAQRIHKKRVINPIQNPRQSIFQGIENPFSPLSLRILGQLGANYLVFHTQPLYDQRHPIDELRHIRYSSVLPPSTDLKAIYEDKGAYIYEIPKNDSDLMVGIISEQEAANWVGSNEKVLAKGTSYLFIGNFTTSTLKSQLSLGSLNKNILLTFPGHPNLTVGTPQEVTLKIGWNIISIDTPEETKISAELKDLTVENVED